MAYRRIYNPKFGDLGIEVTNHWPEAKVIASKGKKTDTLGLALSGGGYRSAIYNYGILKGLHNIGVISQIDYLSVVSGGSWIGMPFSISDNLRWFFDQIDDHPNLIEEGFEALLPNPLRVAQEAALSRGNANYISNIYGRLLAKTFLREHGQASRYKLLSDKTLFHDEKDRPFLIVNGTINYREPGSFSIVQECFEMTRLYCGCRSLGYIHSKDLLASEKVIRIRDTIAISGAAVAVHLPALGGEVAGMGLGREIVNYGKLASNAVAKIADADNLDIADGGHYNNLGIESLINRGCGYIIVVDAEHDPEKKDTTHSNQRYQGLRTLLKRHHIPNPIGEDMISTFDRVDEALHVIDGNDVIPDVLYIKLKSSSAFNEMARDKEYNQPGFLQNVFSAGEFSFDPQFSTAKLDYDFAEHRNLSQLGEFVIAQNADKVRDFVSRST